MQIRGVVLRTAGTFQRVLFCRQLNQVSGDEACRDPQMPENLYEQPCRITAGPRALFKSLLACLDPWIQPRHVANFVSYPAIQVDQKGDRSTLLVREALKKSLEERTGRIDRAVGFEILRQLRGILEGVVFDSWFEEEIKRVERGQLRDEVHFNHKVVRLVWNKEAREMIVVGIELPVE